MPIVVYRASQGGERRVEVRAGETVMRGAVSNDIAGIDADCGGQCACATCHVYVDPAWMDKIGAPSELEASMLGFVADARPNSRLSCQIVMTDDLNELIVTLPSAQH